MLKGNTKISCVLIMSFFILIFMRLSLGETVLASEVENELKPPTNLEAIAGEERIKLTWNTTAGKVAGYAVYRGTSENARFIRIGSSTGTIFNDVNAKEGVLYYYYIKAYDAAGNLSSPSNIARAMIEKKIVTNQFNLYAQPVEGKILLKWSAIEGKSIAGYAVYKSVSPNHNFTRIGSTKDTDYLDPNTTKDIPYYYQVRFYDEKGTISEPSNTAGAIVAVIKKIPENDSQPNTKNIKELTTDEIINPPQNLKAEAGEARIKLTWEKANDKNIKGYAIYRSTTPNARFARIGSTEEGIFNDTEITKGSVYYYQVRAYNLTGQVSLPSNTSRTMVDKETNKYAVPKQKSFWLNIKSLLEKIF